MLQHVSGKYKGQTKHDTPYDNNLKSLLHISGWELILEETNLLGERLRNHFKLQFCNFEMTYVRCFGPMRMLLFVFYSQLLFRFP